MSRWFRHYAGMMRDEKLVRVAVRCKQPVERVVWVWGAILESAAEINDGGRYELDAGEASKFLGTSRRNIVLIENTLASLGRVDKDRVVWGGVQFGEDRPRPSSEIWRRLREFVFKRDDYTCRYCGSRAVSLECDHVVPVARGGGHDVSNLVASCRPCNRSKRDKLVEEWCP